MFFSRLKTRLGEFWWWSLLLFLATRSGDLVQAFVGLWLVPHYVPQSELGAVLPLVQITGVIGLPLSILIIPLMKFANTYATRGEYGKLKSLLRLAFVGAGIAFVTMFILSRFILPAFFERLRVPPGLLGTLILLLGLVGALSPVFGNTLQALKRFRPLFVINALGAPLRLAAMLVTMPFRALSGYLVGQMMPGLLTVGLAFFSLRKELGSSVKAEPFLRADGRAMLRYACPIALNAVVGAILAGWQALLIRQRLPEVESAAYYLISRFAEIGCYAGWSLAVVMFPYAAEAATEGRDANRLLRNLLLGTALAGAVFVLFYAVAGRFILGLMPLWKSYQIYAPQLTLLTVVMALRLVFANFASYEMAQSRFTCLWWLIPLGIVENGGLIVLTGYGYFWGILPDRVVGWLASLDAARLDFFLWWFLAINLAGCVCLAVQLTHRRFSARSSGRPGAA